MSKPEDLKALEPVMDALEQWEAELDPVQRARLTAARRRALSSRNEGTRTYGWLTPALAAGVLLAVGIGFWPQSAVPPPVAAPQAGELAVGDPTAADETLMDEDAEYLLWLASNDAA